MKPIRILLALLAIAACGVLVAACGSDSGSSSNSGSSNSGSSSGQGQIKENSANAKTTLTIGSKNFTEQKVLGEIYAQGLQAAGYKVKTDLNLGDQDVALKAVKTKQIDGYPEYTGTALLAFFGVKANKLPHDPQQAYDETKADFAKQGIVAFPPTPFTDSNEVAVTKQTAQKYHLKKISDLSKVASKLTLYGSPECRKRLDCLLGLEQVYKLHFKKFVPVDVSQRHEVLTSGRADVSIVFTTDPQIKREGEVLLDADHAQGGRRQRGLRPREDDPPAQLAADGPEHAGAQRPRRPRQEVAERGRQGVPAGDRAGGRRVLARGHGRREALDHPPAQPCRVGHRRVVDAVGRVGRPVVVRGDPQVVDRAEHDRREAALERDQAVGRVAEPQAADDVHARVLGRGVDLGEGLGRVGPHPQHPLPLERHEVR
jgi:osmoprotectant transport system substrate-binding protein